MCKIFFSGLISIALLSGYVIFFNYSGVHVRNNTGATDYKWEPYQWKAITKEGYAWNRFDEHGFNNDKVLTDIDILVIGSSHMEAVNVAQSKNVCGLLNEMTDDSTYNIGVSGHNIYTCVKNIDNAVNCYQPKKFVIIETSTIELDVQLMQQVLENKYPDIQSYDTGLLYTIQKKIPVIKILYKAVEEWRSLETSSTDANAKVEPIEIVGNSDVAYVETLDSFLAKAKDSVSSSGAKLIILYHPYTRIDADGRLVDATDKGALSSFQYISEQNDIIFVDMTPDFEKLYEENHILAHGFVNTAVGQGHLNEFGHKIIAERLIEIIGGEN